MSCSMYGWHVLMTIPNETSWINFNVYSFRDGDHLSRTSVSTGRMSNFRSKSCSSFSNTMTFSINSTDFPNGPAIRCANQVMFILILLILFCDWFTSKNDSRTSTFNSPEFVSHFFMIWCNEWSINGISCTSSTKLSGCWHSWIVS